MRSKKFTFNVSKKSEIPKLSGKPKVEKRKNQDRIQKCLNQIKGLIKGTNEGKTDKFSGKDVPKLDFMEMSISKALTKCKNPDDMEQAFNAGFARGISEVYRCLGATNPETKSIRKQLIRTLSKSVPKKFSRIVLQQQQQQGYSADPKHDKNFAYDDGEYEVKPQDSRQSVSFSNISFDDTVSNVIPSFRFGKADTKYSVDTTLVDEAENFGTPVMSSTMMGSNSIMGTPMHTSTPTVSRRLLYSRIDDTHMNDLCMENSVQTRLDMSDMFIHDAKRRGCSNLRDSGNGTCS